MKTILILGAGTAGTAMAHKARRRLSSDWEVAVVDPSTTHVYQPGLLFLPFGDETEERIVRERGSTLGKGITWHRAEVKGIDVQSRRVELDGGEALSYDFLIIASGTETRPDMIEGMLGEEWGKSVVIGTGPFKFVQWDPGQQVIFEKHTEFFKEGLPYLDRVELSLNV